MAYRRRLAFVHDDPLFRRFCEVQVVPTARTVSRLLQGFTMTTVAALQAGSYAIYAVSVLESFGQGLGTACFLTFMMRLCDRRHAATQYALISALFALTRHLSGAASGFAAQRFGYALFFAYTFLLAAPGLALIPLLKTRLAEADRTRELEEESGSSVP